MDEMFIYNHGGSGNHGCEALVRTVCNLLGDGVKMRLYSENPQEDYHYDLHKYAKIEAAMRRFSRFSLSFLRAYVLFKITHNYFYMDILPYRKALRTIRKNMVEISVGGDIYCYDDYPKFIMLHQLLDKKGCKSVLLGCSLDEKLFEDVSFVEDMRRYDYISARESLTYRLLKNTGLKHIGLTPDSAFTLSAEYLPLPENFQEGNTVGIHISPLIMAKESERGIVLKNCEMLIVNILETTDCSIALIPHVVWKDNDDRTALNLLYDKFAHMGRVVRINDCNCMQLKGYIARCRFFIGARTHATIAAYSTFVPTLVLGYSIKSRGIATDLFGTDENYVLSVQDLKQPSDLTKSWEWLQKNEESIRNHLRKVIPSYVEEAKLLKYRVLKAINK